MRKTQRPGVGIAGPLKEGFEQEPGSFSELAAGKQRDRNRASRRNSDDSRDQDRIPFHPLADLFPLMEGAEFDALVADIKANGLREKIDLYQGKVVDGRNRYLALQRLGTDPSADPSKYFRKAIYAHSVGGEIASHEQDNDARVLAYVISKNIHRRHLTPEQKRNLIGKLIKAEPEKSNNAIAKQAKVDDKTVAKVRHGMEARSEIPNVSTRTDTKGRKQPAKKPTKKVVEKPTKKAKAKQLAPKPVKPDPRIIAPELAYRVGRFAHDLILSERLLARELANIIMLPGVCERLSADLTNGLALDAGVDAGPLRRRS